MSLARVWSRWADRGPPTTPPAPMFAPGAAPPFRSVSRSHVGRVRAVNEDRVFDCPTAGLWAVADGMGGHDAGDVAAEIVVKALQALVRGGRPLDDDAVAGALTVASATIAAHAASRNLTSGATVVAMLAAGSAATLFWAGDSRAYRLRGGAAEQLTRDHSVVQEMVDARLIDPAAADHHPQSHIVTRALGTSATVAIDRRRIALAPGELILLCSDGLSRQNEAGLAAPRGATLDASADALLASALAAGGRDNVSLVAIEVGDAR